METTIVVNLHTVVLVAVAVVNVLILGPGGWIIKGLLEDMKKLKRDLESLRTDVQTRYVRRDDFLRAIDELKALIAELREDIKEMGRK